MKFKRGLNNIFTNILGQFIKMVLGIILPHLVLVNLGSEVNGLLNSINQILVYVGLLEAGVGIASLQALYGPVSRDEKQSICQILAATDRFYKRSGRIYFVVVVLLSFIFPLTIQTELSRSDIMWVMFLSGLPGVVNYYFQGKFRILLQAEGKSYILTNLATIVYVCTTLFKIILLLAGFDIVALQAMHLVFNLVQTVYVIVYMKRRYRWLDLSAEPDYDAISQSKNVLVHRISGLIFQNTDVLILTYMCGLATVSVYSMYTLVFSMVAMMITNFDGANFILGQTFHEDRRRYLKLHDLYEVFNMTLTFCLYCIANLFILPFMRLYTSGVSDIVYVDQYLPYLFIATYLLSNGRTSSLQVIDYAQHFKLTQGRSIFESCINITVSILAARRFGIYGVLFGTIAALLYRTNDMIIYANRKILHRSPWITYRRWLLNLVTFIVVTIVGKQFYSSVDLTTYVRIIFWAAISCVVIIPLFFAVALACDGDTYRFVKELIGPYVKRYLHIK